MKRFYLFIFIGVLALAMIVVSLMNFNPAVDTWGSLFAGAAMGLLIVKLPSIIAYFKSKRQKNVK
jgi:hypothetical protein